MLNITKMNDDIWIDTTGSYSSGYYLPTLEAITYVGLGLSLVHRFQMLGVLYAGIATNIIFSVFFKPFVIGRGVMDRHVASAATTKVLSLLSSATVFSLVLVLLRWVTRPIQGESRL